MRRCALMVVVFAVAVVLAGASACPARNADGISIVNKTCLPTDRLADAIAAKGVLTGNLKLLREAALVAPKEPKYWLLAGLFQDPVHFSNKVYRMRLERSLSIDPNYLPALYAYVASKPTYAQRMLGLHRLAALDPDNAKPYYMMAIELYLHTTENRPIVDRNLGAYKVSHDEWQAVVDLIREGNSRARFNAVLVDAPSGRDLSVRMRNHGISAEDVDAGITDYIEDYGLSEDTGFFPLSFPCAARCPQIARQAGFEARHAYRQGESKEAMDTLDVMKMFAFRYAASEPRKLVQVSIGCAIRFIADAAEADILKAMGNESAAKAVKDEGQSSRRILHRLFVASLDQSGELWPSAAKRRAEDANVTKMLKELDWEKQQAR